MLQQKETWNALAEVKAGRNEWGAIPEAERFLKGTGFGYEKPTAIHGWQWSVTFGRWSALVTFADGWHGFTYPEPVRAPGDEDEVEVVAGEGE